MNVIFNIGLDIPWQLIKIYLQYYFGAMGIRYLNALCADYIINRKRGISLIVAVTVVPAVAWTSQFIIAVYVLINNIQDRDCDNSAQDANNFIALFFELTTEIQCLFILYLINYMASGLNLKQKDEK
jgi:hypothetical protein